MADWNPALYSRYEDERTRPARELLARVPLATPRWVVDLGCGPGNSTELLVQRFPDARVTGIDNSPAMLESARQRLPGVAFSLADIASWRPEGAPDLIYANAALQWVPGHEALFPRLFALLAPGGVLAVQMPDNLDEPSHRLMRETAAQPRFATAIGDASRVREPRRPITTYYDLLAGDAERVDAWHTVYQHRMDSAAAIVEWVSATGLRPFIDPLDAAQRSDFLADYQGRIAAAYPTRADGRRLLAFPRLFVVAQRPS
ncbi:MULTISPECIES: trans-aconitate 2-methyltransferase [unclassified Hydrogenophaga]|uniref:trans-aconitate 2-methyltransferase n=1 Tax=unclassified Hydrogenophaga TaxID=2610897 RepID=UPI0008785450|nr:MULTISPECIES: trans-aconitate 2-methyltransferase [unclassified Hydrogenophaga]MBN9369504.1 trans-aconitate 2-methyltransferase [Hydrogenophaga sp.]OJV38280.1 MAG: trans-aconitate 2-methyltransferase [Hydrogenophaga sp. 70-12]